MNTWLLLLNIIIQTSSGPVVYLDTVAASSKAECERIGAHMRNELMTGVNWFGGDSSVTTTCTLKSQRVL